MLYKIKICRLEKYKHRRTHTKYKNIFYTLKWLQQQFDFKYRIQRVNNASNNAYLNKNSRVTNF